MSSTESIYQTLKKRLDENVYSPGSKFPSEAILSAEFGVSKVTVNKIVSRLVEQGLLARGIRGAGTRVCRKFFQPRGTIAFIGKLNPYTMRILDGFQQECLQCGYFAAVFSPKSEELQYCLHILNSKNVCGIVSAGYGVIHHDSELPTVCLDCNLPHQPYEDGVHFIDCDNFTGGKRIMEEILRRGHREIAVFSAERFVISTAAEITARVRGFHAALREAGLEHLIHRTFYGMPQSLPDAKNCLISILQSYPETTLICCDSDPCAEMLSGVAKSIGVSCPGKIALTGFGNVTHLPIASVDQNPEWQGQLAVRYVRDSRPENRNNSRLEPLVESFPVNPDYIPICVNR